MSWNDDTLINISPCEPFFLCLVLKKSGLVFLAFEWVSSCSCKYVFFLPFVFLSCFMFLERLFFLLFVCLLALQVVLKGGDLHWVSGSENQNSWRENGLNLSTICAFSFLSCSCFLPFAFYLESFFFFGTCPLERALVCVWKTVKESISRAKGIWKAI